MVSSGVSSITTKDRHFFTMQQALQIVPFHKSQCAITGINPEAILLRVDRYDCPLCPGLQPGPPSQTPGGLGQRYWSVSAVTWPPKLELRRSGSSGPSSLMHCGVGIRWVKFRTPPANVLWPRDWPSRPMSRMMIGQRQAALWVFSQLSGDSKMKWLGIGHT